MTIQIICCDVAPFGEFPVRKADGLLLLATERTSIEDEEELVSFVLGRCPVDNEHGADGSGEAEFFLDLANARCMGGLAGFDVAAGDVPVVFVAGADEEHVAFVVEEESACSDAWGCHGWHLVGRHQGSLDGLRSVEHLEPTSQADQFARGLAALPADPGEGELAAEEVVADLFGGHLFGVEQLGLGVVDPVP